VYGSVRIGLPSTEGGEVSAAAEPAPVSKPRFDYPVAESPVCDIVMKGGVTSGVVYPLAICELATVYRFKSIGGTSAGAIAAVATAAAEYRRRKHGSVEGFELLEGLPRWVGATAARTAVRSTGRTWSRCSSRIPTPRPFSTR
jgi:predicted acylesterase/phospholipase RssA